MKRKSKATAALNTIAIDLFCGAGGLTHGFGLEGIKVAAGIDLDQACRYAYETNNSSIFINKDVRDISKGELLKIYKDATIKILAGCAPCQPFSTYSNRYDRTEDNKWNLLYEFGRLTKDVSPDIITMENVPSLIKHNVFLDFVTALKTLGYFVSYQVVDSSLYKVPQSRKRLVLLASKFGEIELLEPVIKKAITVEQAIGKLKPIHAGETDKKDKLHTSAGLSELNLKRIRASRQGGSWREWSEDLIVECHRAKSGKTYSSVYGRMSWNKPAPTMTTQCFGYGNGRFGHPEQDRGISLREAAILQSFPKKYKFISPNDEINIKVLGRLIGNAVPVELGRAIGKSINKHILDHYDR